MPYPPFTPEEWALLARAPFMSGLVITLAAPSGISGILEESNAITQNLLSAQQTASPLIVQLVADIQNSKGQLAKPSTKLSPKTAIQTALATLGQTAQLLQLKANEEEATVFKDWLLLIAQDTALAAKEGGFVGIGGTQISQAEERALERIRAALGL